MFTHYSTESKGDNKFIDNVIDVDKMNVNIVGSRTAYFEWTRSTDNK